MPKYTVTLTDAEVRAMEHVCVDPQEWVDTAFRHRVMTATMGLSDLEIAKAIKLGQSIITDREKLVAESKEPAMAEWLLEEDYNPNPDAPYSNPLYNFDNVVQPELPEIPTSEVVVNTEEESKE